MIFSDFPKVEVVRVIDGDTLKVNLGEGYPAIFREMSVRIKNIDAPEMHSKSECEKRDATLAKAELISFIGKADVDLYFCTGDKYWRLNCSVIKEYQDLGERMLRKKLAVNYSGGTKIGWKCNEKAMRSK